MAAKKYRINDVYDDGYTEYDKETGKKEHFIKYGGVLSEGYIGDHGSVRKRDKVSGNIYIKGQGKSEGENFRKGLYGDDDYYGDKGSYITKHVYDNGYTIKDKDGDTKRVHKYHNAFTDEYLSDDGDSYRIDRPTNHKNTRNSALSGHQKANDLLAGLHDRPKNPNLETNYYYQSQLDKASFIPEKYIVAYVIIVAYIILSQIFSFIPKLDILNHALLIGGLLMFAIVTGELSIKMPDTILATICIWTSNTIFHSLSFAYPRNHAFFSEHFWISGAKTATITLAVAVVVYILGRLHIWAKLLNRIIKKPKKK